MEIVEFSWMSSLFGGFLLGISAMVLLVFRGDVAGINGMVSGILSFKFKEMGWRINFVVGLIIGVFIYQWAYGSTSLVLEPLVETKWVILAGFIVGIGATIGNGCTSGHGICGMSRFSVRSIVATFTFITTGIITVYLVHHMGVLG